MPTSAKIDYLKERLSELGSTPAWSGQVGFHSLDGHRVTIQVGNLFVRDWIRENFMPGLLLKIAELPGDELSFCFLVEPLSANKTLEEASHTPPSSSFEAEARVPAETGLSVEEAERAVFHETLKPKYTFESFVVGPANQFAHAAAQAVARLPGQNYNPLFIYGGVGLGKTHLLNAIGMESMKNNPRARVIYISSEKFMNELIHCLRYQKMSEFRKKYRDNCDVLLVDDIQFIAGKERTQEEFFHTFNHLHDGRKQIVLTSDKTPRDIPGLEERLRSRFEWGLIADIQVPDLETRVAILKRKAFEDGIKVDDDVAFFLASHIKSNVRELEGSLIRVNAFASLGGKTMSVEYARDVLKNVLGGVDRILTIEQVQKTVAEFFNLKMGELTGKRRMRSMALPRQIAMYLSRKHVKSSYPEIGSKFGGKDHSTVVHAFSKIQKSIDKDPVLREQVQALEQNLSR